jgi:sugar transferase (PEP-CTERM system associated)
VGSARFKRRVLVLGAGERAARIDRLARESGGRQRYKIVGYLPVDGGSKVGVDRIVKQQGPIREVAARLKVEEIIVAMDERRRGRIPVLDLLACRLDGIYVADGTAFLEKESGHVDLKSLDESHFLLSDGFDRGPLRRYVKRFFDLAASLLLFVLTLPIMAVATLLILIESGQPILYRQTRVGQGGRYFTILKFRSMKRDAENGGTPQWAQESDDRVTRVGRVIRKLRIDELPQTINVIKGDMSFVGPRPERPFFVEDLQSRLSLYNYRHTVKPGITGWAQIRYPYGASIEDAIEKLQYDLYYVKNQTLFLDLIIMLQTAQVVLFGKGAR